MAETNSNPLRAAIIASLTAMPKEQIIAAFRPVARRDWPRLGTWLHASGLALYLLNALQQRGLTALLPHDLLQSLLQNREDNRERVNSLVAEFVQLNTVYRNEGIRYVNLKGFSLGPEYCPDFALRSQFDLDFLVCKDQLVTCKSVMQRMGYEIVAENEALIEFRAGDHAYPKIRDLYKPRTQRIVEFHIVPSRDFDRLPMANGLIGQFVFPTLSREATFLRQGLHLTKHLRSEWTRASSMLEFSRAIEDAYADQGFWRRVEAQVVSSQAAANIGIAVLAATSVFRTAIPTHLEQWSVDQMPEGARRWVREYALPVATASFPGSKLYLLLDRELGADGGCYRSQRRAALWPARVPGFITTPVGAKTRLKNVISDMKYVGFRAAFHFREGMRFLREERKWKKRGNVASLPSVAHGSSPA